MKISVNVTLTLSELFLLRSLLKERYRSRCFEDEAGLYDSLFAKLNFDNEVHLSNLEAFRAASDGSTPVSDNSNFSVDDY